MSADSQDPPPLHQVSPLLSLHAFNFAEHFKIELRREEEEKWWVSVGAFGREEGERASYPSLPVQAHHPRSEKFKLGGLRLRGESWEEALYRYSFADLVPGVQKLGGEKFAFPPSRAMGSSAPQFRFPRYWGGARAHFFLFFFVLCPVRKQSGYETRRRSGVEKNEEGKTRRGRTHSPPLCNVFRRCPPPPLLRRLFFSGAKK